MLAHRLLPSGSAGVSRHLPCDVEQPAVKRAAQAAVLQPAEREIGAAMRAGATDQAVAALLVPEDDEVFAEQPDRLDRPVAGELVDQRGRLPIAAHQRSRRLARSDRVIRSFCSALSMAETPKPPLPPLRRRL